MIQEAKNILQQELEDLKKRIIANHEHAGQVASGRTRASLRVETSDEGGVLWGRSPFGTLETGRKPGKVPKGFYHIILQWVKDKGIKVDNPKTFSYFVSRKIAREGTELFRSGGRADIYSNEIPVTIENIGNRMVVLIGIEVEHINLNSNETNSI
jgi:hypothetical protein